MPLRYNDFPAGLGKGHDCGVVSSWLQEQLEAVDVASVAPELNISTFWRDGGRGLKYCLGLVGGRLL